MNSTSLPWSQLITAPPPPPPFGGIHPRDIPIESLLPSIRDAIHEISRNIESPQPLIVSSIYATLSAACQNGCVVKHPQGFTSPVSLYFITLAESGERKTQTDRFTSRTLRAFQKKQDEINAKNKNDFQASFTRWKEQRKILLDELRRKTRKSEDTKALKAEIEAHDQKQPARRQGYKLLLNNITGPAFSRTLNEHYPCTGIFSDEGLTALKAVALDNLGNLNSAWSGSDLYFDRSNSESFTVANPRVTISLMFQPGVLEKLLCKENNLWHESGLLARTLITRPLSKSGMRNVPLSEFDWSALEVFESRINTLLAQSHPEEGVAEPEILHLSPNALHAWAAFAKQVENHQLPLGYLKDVKNFASKIAENAIRMAALNQRMESNDLEISLQNMNQAIGVCGWYLDEYVNLFGPASELPIEQEMANKLFNWLWAKCLRQGIPYRIPKEYVRRYGPNSLRNSTTLDLAYELLQRQSKLWIHQEGRTHFIVMNREHPSSPFARAFSPLI